MAQYADISQLLSNSITPDMAANFSTDAMNSALQAASDKASSYLRSQQILPLISWDMQLVQVVCDMATYRLFAQYGQNPNALQNTVLGQRYKEAVEWLEAVADQKIIVQYPDSDPAFNKAGPFVLTSQSPVGFARLTNCGYRRWQ